ncbi:MAG: hypothetical protein LIP12_09985 [Clostridiales bacterium]|nr:hypothetical protein [Clostridiales bacterium]
MEKLYYTENKQMEEIYWGREKSEEYGWNQAECDALMEQAEETPRIISPKKRKLFEKMVEQADFVANSMILDLRTHEKDGLGIITMEGEDISFSNIGSKSWNEARKLFANLMLNADYFEIMPIKGMQNIRFVFRLFDLV